MNRCLRIVIIADLPEDFLHSYVQKHARKCGLEGVAQWAVAEKQVRIIACGDGDMLDKFVDAVHEGIAGFVVDQVEIEPFLKDKDYRSVFRVIE